MGIQTTEDKTLSKCNKETKRGGTVKSSKKNVGGKRMGAGGDRIETPIRKALFRGLGPQESQWFKQGKAQQDGKSGYFKWSGEIKSCYGVDGRDLWRRRPPRLKKKNPNLGMGGVISPRWMVITRGRRGRPHRPK